MIKRILFLFMLMFSHLSSSAGITDGKFGMAQIFDVQYYWSGTTLNASNFIAPYDMNWSNPTLTNGQYFAFFASTTVQGQWGLGIYNSNGTRASIVHNEGTIEALGNGAIFYIGSGFFGNVITTSQGYSYGASATFTNMDIDVTSTDLSNYTWASTAPLASGQTATTTQPSSPTVTGTNTSYTYRTSVSGNITRVYRTLVTTTTYSDNTTSSSSGTEELYYTATSTVTEVGSSNTQQGVVTTTTTRVDTVYANGSQTTSYSSSSVTTPWPSYVTIGGGNVSQDIVINTNSNITTGNQIKVDAWTNKVIIDGNRIFIDQVSGSNNTVTMTQDGNKNLINLQLQGTNNNIIARQGVQGTGQNEMKLNFEGNNNVVNLNQARDTQGNALGTNGHYLDATIAGWGTSLTVQQTNSGGVGGHYNETTVSGNGNNVLTKQIGNGNKIMFVKVDGALNTVDATQRGTGQHKLDATLTGDHNNATILQEGSITNNATLNLTNAGGPASVIIQQNGGQSVGVTTSCGTAGGCAPITVRQGY